MIVNDRCYVFAYNCGCFRWYVGTMVHWYYLKLISTSINLIFKIINI